MRPNDNCKPKDSLIKKRLGQYFLQYRIAEFIGRQRYMTVTRGITVALIAITLIFGAMVTYSSILPAKPETEVPYVGMTLAYDLNKTWNIGSSQTRDFTQTVIDYVTKTPDSLFQVNAYEELFTFSLLVNASSRQYVSGTANGSYVGHLIPTKLSMGDVVMIYQRRNFTVFSTNDTFEIEKGLRVTSFKLRFHQEWVQGDTNYSQTIIRYYDTKYGIMLKELDNDISYNPGYNIIAHHLQTTLVDDKTDNNGDGLSTYQRLFKGSLNSSLQVNGLIMASLATAAVATFLIAREASKRRIKSVV